MGNMPSCSIRAFTFDRVKPGSNKLKLWTPRLRMAISRARINQGKISSIWVVHTRTGQRYTCSGFETMLARARNAAGLRDPFTFHDIEAKGVSNHEGDKQAFSGYKTRAQMEGYDRRRDVVTALD